MKLTHIVIASSAFLSLGAFAEGTKATADKQAQAGAATQPQAHSSAVIKQAQDRLRTAGHDTGPADGTMSAKTVQALKDFQKSKGFETTGQLDQRTLAALGVSAAGVGGTSSPAPAAGVGSSSEKAPRERSPKPY
jgi:peptidoglycan hydrolase-like protein with peptidoglycan-binding domain